MNPLRSLRARVALAAVVALAVSLLVAGGLLLSAVSRDGRSAVDRDLQRRADHLIGRVPDRGSAPGPEGGEALLAGSGTFVRVIASGQVVEERGDHPSQVPPLPTHDGLSTVALDGTPWRSLVLTGGSDPAGPRLQLFQSLAAVERRVGETRRLIVLFGLLALALTALAASAATSFVLRPLARLRAAAAKVSSTQDLRSRLPHDNTDPIEVGAMTESLNAMLARLEASAAVTERALRATRRFAADAGHELRTPMTSLRANLDVVLGNPGMGEADRRQALEEMRAEQQRMTALLEGLQALARGEAADAVPREPIELGDLLDAALQSARARHPSVRFELQDSSDEAAVNGWGDGLRMLVDNLLDNAALHGKGEQGHVVAGLRRNGSEAVEIFVDDDGSGVPADERQRLLEPFARGAGVTSPGTGLGLAVVAQQAALHGGEVRLAEARGGGLRAAVSLPALVRPGHTP